MNASPICSSHKYSSDLSLSIHYKKEDSGIKLLNRIDLISPGEKQPKEINIAHFWINDLPAEHIKRFCHLETPNGICLGLTLERERLERGLIPQFEVTGSITKEEIAKYLWLKSRDLVTDEIFQKVNTIAIYIKKLGFELVGVPRDNNCFCNSFLKSYEVLSKKIPGLDNHPNKVAYLRNLIANQYEKKYIKPRRVTRIKNGENLKVEEGILLAKALKIHIRIISIGAKGSITDHLIFPEKNEYTQYWNCIKSNRPKKYISIVQLEDHFICARPMGEQICSLNLENWKWAVEESKKLKEIKKEIREVKVIEEIEIKIKYRDETGPGIPVPTSLKVIGLKKHMAKKLYNQTEIPFKDWELIYQGCLLSNENTLDECGLNKESKNKTFELRFEEGPKGHRNQQMATLGTYKLIEGEKGFKNYFSSMSKKLPIVCRIFTSDGNSATGFLIGKNKIITNSHVLSEIKDGESNRACFFYREGTEKEIYVDLVKVDYYSHPPADILGNLTEDSLDFSIVSFVSKKANETILNQLVRVAHPFFKEHIYKEEGKTLIQKRANIIQHPAPNDIREDKEKEKIFFEDPEGRKTIAFRENVIKSAKQCCLHYESKTSEGSSGSPVISDEDEFIGLHCSMCKIIDRALFGELENLLKELKIPYTEMGQYYHWLEDNREMKLYHKGAEKKNRGKWEVSLQNKSQIGSLRDLVKHIKKDNGEEWILDFLKEKKPDEAKYYEEHMYCNTAVPAGRIFENMRLNWATGYEKMKSESIELIKKLDRQEKFEPMVTIAIGLLTIGVIVWLLTDKSKDTD